MTMQFLPLYKSHFEQYLEQHQLLHAPQGLYAPINYIMGIGGKRLRPVALMMAYHLFKEDFEKALPAALAVEMFHNFTLVHDDIMDAAPLRRGFETVHKKYGVNTGILSGDVMLIYAYKYFSSIEDLQVKDRVWQLFTEIAIEVCEGQQYDVDFEERPDVRIEEYLKMIELKTAVLFAAALKIGALLAGAGQEQSDHLFEFGRKVGIAFQLQDDLLDSFGDPKKFGKKVGGDIAQNKKTYLVLKTLEVGSPTVQQALRHWMSARPESDTEKIEAVKALFEEAGVVGDIEALKEQYLQEAFTALAQVKGHPDRLQHFEQLADYLLGRDL